jgi:hypothetical protein
MRRPTRVAVAHLVYVLTERGMRHRDAQCSCRRPVPVLVDDAVQSAIDDVEKALQEDPETRAEWLETD